MTLTAEDAQRLQECLSGDGVAVIPTDTVYGLACNPHSEQAVRRIYELKGRPPSKPSAVMFFALAAALEALGELGPRTCAALEALLPGPVTLLLPNPSGSFPLASDAATGGGGGDDGGDGGGGTSTAAIDAPALGVRVPLFDGPLAALAEVSVPALQSSANLSGGPDPRRLCDVPEQLRDGADLVLDGAELPGMASTVVDLAAYEERDTWSIVRAGAVGETAVRQALG